VYYFSNKGNDNNKGTSANAPKRTLAVAAMEYGSSGHGHYTVSKTGKLKSRLTMKNV
jgi:hypothetical protein